jgi:hypothetical protein
MPLRQIAQHLGRTFPAVNARGAHLGLKKRVYITRINDMTGAGWITLGGWAAGSGVNQFTQPNGVVVTAAGQIFVTDHNNSRRAVLGNACAP